MQEPGTKGLKNNDITVEIKTKKQHNQQQTGRLGRHKVLWN